MSAIDDIAAERKRQIEVEGWSAGHDDKQRDGGELASAAACYAIASTRPWKWNHFLDVAVERIWPWNMDWWKPTTKRRNLVKAGALIIAEIERLDRASAAKAA